MYGELTAAEIDALLRRHRYGRVGFTLDDETYVIPINYGYDGACLFGQAPTGSKGQMPGGTKIAGMRQHPHVAFEVDEIQDPAHWRSVLLHGRFRELHGRAEKQAAFERIIAQADGGERSEVSWAWISIISWCLPSRSPSGTGALSSGKPTACGRCPKGLCRPWPAQIEWAGNR